MKKGKEKTINERFPSHREIRQFITKYVEKITYSDREERIYFDELFELSKQIKWKNIKPHDRVEFFRRWFIVISDTYMKAFKKYELLEKQPHDYKNEVSSVFSSFLMQRDQSFVNGKCEWLKFNEEALLFYWNCWILFSIPIEREGRDLYLFKEYYKNFADPNEASVRLPFAIPPVELTTVTEAKEMTLPKIGAHALELCWINFEYPNNVIMEELERMLNKKREKHFQRVPERRNLFSPKTKDGRRLRYPFDDWARYLKVFLLKKIGKKNKELTELFYTEQHQDPKRQVVRDRQKAERLSQNAVARNFPGKY